MRFDVRTFAENLGRIYGAQMQGEMAGAQAAQQQAAQTFGQQMQMAGLQDERQRQDLSTLMSLKDQMDPSELARLAQAGINRPSPYAGLATSPYAQRQGLSPFLQGMSPQAPRQPMAPTGVAPGQPPLAPQEPDKGTIATQYGTFNIGGNVDKAARDNAYKEYQRLGQWIGRAQFTDPAQRQRVVEAFSRFPQEIKSRDDLQRAQNAIQEMRLYEAGNERDAYSFRETQRAKVGTQYDQGLKLLTDPRTSPGEIVGLARQLRNLEKSGEQYQDLNPTRGVLAPFDADLADMEQALKEKDRSGALKIAQRIKDQVQRGVDPKEEKSNLNSFINFTKLLPAKQLNDPKFMREQMRRFGLGQLEEGLPDSQIPFLAGQRTEAELGRLVRQAARTDFARLDPTSQSMVLDRIAELAHLGGSNVTIPKQVLEHMSPYQQWVLTSGNSRLDLAYAREGRLGRKEARDITAFGERLPEQAKSVLQAKDAELAAARKALDQLREDYVINPQEVLTKASSGAPLNKVESEWYQQFGEVGRLMNERERLFTNATERAQEAPPAPVPLPTRPSSTTNQPAARRAPGPAGAAVKERPGPPLPSAKGVNLPPPTQGGAAPPKGGAQTSPLPTAQKRSSIQADTPVTLTTPQGRKLVTTRKQFWQAKYQQAIKARLSPKDAQAYANEQVAGIH